MKKIPWWVWASAAPLALGAWAPIAPGIECRRRAWTAWGVLWTLLAIAGWVLANVGDGGSGSGLLIVIAWIGPIATTLLIRPAYRSGFAQERAAAERRLRERREAQRLVAERPALAREL